MWSLQVGGSGQYAPGDAVQLSGSGLPPGATVDAEIHSTPQHLGSTAVDADGAFQLTAVIPDTIEPGAHTIVVTVTDPDGQPSPAQQPVTITAPAPAPTTDDDGGADGGAGVAGPGDARDDSIPSSATDRSEPAAPSALTYSLDTIRDIIRNPLVVAAAGGAGLALLLFVAIPAELLNATLSEQYERLSRRVPVLRRRPSWVDRFMTILASTPVLGGIAVTLAASIIFGFVDPAFGFDLTSLRVVLACFLGLFIVGFVTNAITGLFAARRWNLGSQMDLKPLGLLLAAIGVVISRLIDFSPGFLIGLLLGLTLTGAATTAQQARATLFRSGLIYAFAVAAWIGYSLVPEGWSQTSFASALTVDTLVAITTEGLTALLVGLLPFAYLDGQVLFRHSKVMWGAAYAVAAASFVLIVVPNSFGEVGQPLWIWAAVVIGFSVLAVLLYLYFRIWAPRDDDDESEQRRTTSHSGAHAE